MFIRPMTPLSEVEWEKNKFFNDTAPKTDGINVFRDVFLNAVDEVRRTDMDYSEKEYLFATGQLEDPAQLTVAATKAQTSVDFLVTLRNRALDTYNELMRMNI